MNHPYPSIKCINQAKQRKKQQQQQQQIKPHHNTIIGTNKQTNKYGPEFETLNISYADNEL
ncbi:hypothetical protein DERF_002596 [Dermatophagoides farinae]|uniref:Uncharacterized protein n=1 Tax=Dermatophagoides farinae TaxID=6954 RepID=A0A922IBW6_DERFA|nr:hypothetical protein DERF_002596 [Dermatophagoides farinae]